ncbi:HAD-IA family hydrolase [Solwaraspora sp. WMMB335]|uniref:HAD-IA family hydrolase n=1 Tax=Solwaraspora sp. WMMB335 TaxID=3404118 RepID=UPI003B951251
MSSWLVFDYGQVISLPQPSAAVAAMAETAGLPLAEFTRRYWRHRDEYDGGCSPQRYWSQVVGRPLAAEAPLVTDLDRLDVASWSHLNSQTLDLLDAFTAAGHRLALLSNAPASLATAIEAAAWAAGFEHLLFSCRLALAKPDPAVYRALLRRLGAQPSQVTFVDDRVENVRAAARSGITALHYPQLAIVAVADDE